MSKLFWTLAHKSSSADFLSHVYLNPNKCLIILILKESSPGFVRIQSPLDRFGSILKLIRKIKHRACSDTFSCRDFLTRGFDWS